MYNECHSTHFYREEMLITPITEVQCRHNLWKSGRNLWMTDDIKQFWLEKIRSQAKRKRERERERDRDREAAVKNQECECETSETISVARHTMDTVHETSCRKIDSIWRTTYIYKVIICELHYALRPWCGWLTQSVMFMTHDYNWQSGP